MDDIPYSCQWIEQGDIDAVDAVLRSDRLTQGPKVAEFERRLAKSCGAAGAVAVSSGTAALHLACLAIGVESGWEIITSPISFVATANCALYCGARPCFVDIDPATYTLDPNKLETYLRRASSHSRSTRRIVLPVHFAGQPCRMDAIREIANRYGAIVIEDGAHALGAHWRDAEGIRHAVGSGSHGLLTAFSFHPVKHITTAEGGALLSNDRELLDKIRMLRSHGITQDPEHIAKGEGPWYYEMQLLGYNYRISDMQCALGLQQLARLDEIVARRRAIAYRYTAALSGSPAITVPQQREGTESSFHLYVIQLKLDRFRKNKQEIVQELVKKNIRTQVHYIPIHLQPYYRKQFGYKAGEYPVAEDYYRAALSIPLYPTMTDLQVDHVIESLREVLGS